MFLSRLELTHFRNYADLDLTFDRPVTLLQGRNAQGKTNLLEAIYYLATSKSSHARTEKEVVGWSAADEPLPYSQIAGTVRSSDETLRLEILFTARDADSTNYSKRIRINGVDRRGMDLVGRMRAVLFLPEDIVLVSGSPSERRRYLDVALCQLDRNYCQHLARYQKVVSQRNSLLRSLRDQGASPSDSSVARQIAFWDEQLARHGSQVITGRYDFLSQMDPIARSRHRALSDYGEELRLVYLPSFDPGHLGADGLRQLRAGDTSKELTGFPRPRLTANDVAEALLGKLVQRRQRELAAGSTLYGPHRDDMAFLVDENDLRTFGSRGQQRTAALALKLAEVQTMTSRTGEPPLLLLDDVMSELDAVRRSMLMEGLMDVEQVVITATDWSDFSTDLLAQAQRLHVEAGRITPQVPAHVPTGGQTAADRTTRSSD